MGEIKLGKYRHYKGNFYEVLGIGRHTETKEEFIVYKQLYDGLEFPIGSIWIRPREMFFEEVEVSGQKTLRFKFIGQDV